MGKRAPTHLRQKVGGEGYRLYMDNDGYMLAVPTMPSPRWLNTNLQRVPAVLKHSKAAANIPTGSNRSSSVECTPWDTQRSSANRRSYTLLSAARG